MRRLVGTVALALLPSAVVGEDGRAATALDQEQVHLAVEAMARRDVVDGLLAPFGIAVEWRSATFANEVVRGSFSGDVATVARQLLASANFVAVYDDERLSQLIVFGVDHGGSEPREAALAALERALRRTPRAAGSPDAPARAEPGPAFPGLITPASEPAPVIAPPPPGSTIPTLTPVVDGAVLLITPPSPADLAIPQITPPPPDGLLPPLMPAVDASAEPPTTPSDRLK